MYISVTHQLLSLISGSRLLFSVTVKAVAKSAHRALGLLIAKSKCNGGMPFECFSKLYDALVLSIINYGSAVWGTREYSVINAVHNRACRFFLGVGKYTPSAAVQGDMGWKTPVHQQWMSVTRLWCRLCNMDGTFRLNKRIFEWCYSEADRGVHNWVHVVKRFHGEIHMEYLMPVDNEFCVHTTLMALDTILRNMYSQRWLDSVDKVDGRGGTRNKLRTYSIFKREFKTETYVRNIMNKGNRSALAKFRCGVAPIRIETGRYERNYPAPENRTCYNCHELIEDEFHVLMCCPTYDRERRILCDFASSHDPTFNILSENDKFIYFMSNDIIINQTARTLKNILSIRNHHTSRITV